MAVRGERRSREAALCIVHVGKAARAGDGCGGTTCWQRRAEDDEGMVAKARGARTHVGKLY